MERGVFQRFSCNEHSLQVMLLLRTLKKPFAKPAPVRALDFNRFGMAFHYPEAIPSGTKLRLKIDDGRAAVNVVGVVHNCHVLPDGADGVAPGFRCGVQFRPSNDELDRLAIETALETIESHLASPEAAPAAQPPSFFG